MVMMLMMMMMMINVVMIVTSRVIYDDLFIVHLRACLVCLSLSLHKVSVAQRFLNDIEDIEDNLRVTMAEHMSEVHLSVSKASQRYKEVERRYNYTTPKSFLELISFYKVTPCSWLTCHIHSSCHAHLLNIFVLTLRASRPTSPGR